MIKINTGHGDVVNVESRSIYELYEDDLYIGTAYFEFKDSDTVFTKGEVRVKLQYPSPYGGGPGDMPATALFWEARSNYDPQISCEVVNLSVPKELLNKGVAKFIFKIIYNHIPVAYRDNLVLEGKLTDDDPAFEKTQCWNAVLRFDLPDLYYICDEKGNGEFKGLINPKKLVHPKITVREVTPSPD